MMIPQLGNLSQSYSTLVTALEAHDDIQLDFVSIFLFMSKRDLAMVSYLGQQHSALVGAYKRENI